MKSRNNPKDDGQKAIHSLLYKQKKPHRDTSERYAFSSDRR